MFLSSRRCRIQSSLACLCCADISGNVRPEEVKKKKTKKKEKAKLSFDDDEEGGENSNCKVLLSDYFPCLEPSILMKRMNPRNSASEKEIEGDEEPHSRYLFPSR